MGRPRKPTALKILDGDRADRIAGDEPTAPPGIGDPPSWLDRHGREAWADLVESHRVGSLLTRLDVASATLYCQSYSSYRHALETITRDLARSSAVLDEDAPGAEPARPHPMFRVVNESHRQMCRILSKFGMTPSDRAGLHIQEKPAEDDLMSFLATPASNNGKRRGKAPRE